MTDRRTRLPRAWVRAIAWVVGGATFLSVAGAFGAVPKPASSSPSKETAAPRRVIIRKIVRRIVIVDAPRTTVNQPVAASAPISSSSSQSSGPSGPSAPTTSTGGS